MQIQVSCGSTNRQGRIWICSFLRLLFDLAQSSQRSLALLKFIEVVGDVSNGVDQHHKASEVAA
ncbi:MAG: Uncharacterised protein [Synechococcus sp. MIT S9220]|nr:MAG: Uncharacterised protein [Synechococcus sp. MIT S9220]